MQSEYTQADAARFWRFVVKADAADGCWEWQADRNKSGHGRFYWQRIKGYAHRFSYIIHIGPIPSGLLVRHRCDNPPCVNPDHLLLGTKADNAQDAKERGLVASGERNAARRHPERVPKGDRHPNRKLSWAQACEIRDRLAAGGIRQVDLAREYGVSPARICEILSGAAWREPR